MDLLGLIRQTTQRQGESIKAVTTDLEKALKKPDSINQLLLIVNDTHIEAETRDAASVFLRRKLEQWSTWEEHLKMKVKTDVLMLLDQQKTDRNCSLTRSAIQLASAIFEMELTNDLAWSDLLNWTETNCNSTNSECRQAAFDLLVSITELSDERMERFITSLLELVSKGFQDGACPQVRYASLKIAGNLVIHANDQNNNLFVPLVEQSTQVIRSLQSESVTLDTDPFNALNESLTNVALVSLINLQPALELSVEIACDKGAFEYLRKCALQFVTEVVRHRSSILIKTQAVETLFNRIFQLMCILDESETEEDTMLHSCTQVVDTLCQRLPSSSFVPIIQQQVYGGTKSDNVFVRRASFLTLAVSMEGCCRFYVEHCLEQLLTLIIQGIQDKEGAVSLSSLFALGELLSYSDSSACDYASVFMPVVLDCLEKVINVDYENSDESTCLYVSRAFFALEEACECLDNDLHVYLSDLFAKLKSIHENSKSQRMHQLSLESISFAVSAVDKLINPYVVDLLALLNPYLSKKSDDGPFAEALGALSCIFRYSDDPVVEQHADNALQFAIKLLSDSNYEPELRSAAFDVLAALTCIYKNQIGKDVVEVMIKEISQTFDCTEGILCPPFTSEAPENGSDTCIAQRTRSSNGLVPNLSEDDDSDIDDDESDVDSDEIDIIESEFADERVSALSLLSDLSNNSINVFAPFIDALLEPVFKHLDFPDENIQSQAIRTYVNLVSNLYNICNSTENTPFDKAQMMEMIASKLESLYSDLEEKVQECDIQDVVIASLNGIQSLVSCLGSEIFKVLDVTKLGALVEEVLNRKIPCLNEICDENIEEPELDSRVLEAAGDIIPVCGDALTVEKFQECFGKSLNILIAQLKHPNGTRKAYVIGTVACVVNSNDNLLIDPELAFQLFNTFLSDSVDEVAQNAAYGIGLIFKRVPEQYKSQCDSILNQLHSLYQRTVNVEKSSLRDNVCGCACRIIRVTGFQQQILEFIMSMFPMQADRENYTAFFEMITEFANEQLVKSNANNFAQLACSLILDKSDDLLAETKQSCAQYIRVAGQDVSEIINKLTDSEKEIISQYMST